MPRNYVPHPTCSGICKKYQALKPVAGGRYSQGQKRCQMCIKWIKFEGIRCLCCNYRLRNRSRLARCKPALTRM